LNKSEGNVRGRRSPNWAVWAKMLIPCKGGKDYLFRLRIIATPWFGIYLHDIFEDDGDRDPHNHPWSFISIVLRGYYVERLFPDPVNRRDHYVEKTHPQWSVHRMGRDTAHRIVYAAPGLKTLILVGPRRSSWGFFKRNPVVDRGGVLVDWKDYEREIGTYG
jgi:hypothetical protein